MKGIEFFFLVEYNIVLYLLILIGCLLVYFLFFKKYWISIFDPLVYLELSAAFAASVVVFLWVMGYIRYTLFIHFVITEIAFILGFRCLSGHKLKQINKNTISYSLNEIDLFKTCSIVYVVLMLFTYYKQGIPLFMDSRLELFDNSGGLGIIGRITDVLQILLLTESILIYKYKPIHKNFCIFNFVFIILTIGLTGSKSSMMLPLFVLFILAFTNNGIFLKFKGKILLLSTALIFSLLVLLIQNNSDADVILALIQRFVANGDVFYQSYPNDLIYHLKGNAYDFIAGPILRTFRLVNTTEEGLGNQIFWELTHNHLNAGPNPRINLLTYVCFGYYGSFAACFIFGFLTSYIRNKISINISNKPFIISIYSYVYIKMLNFQTDITLCVNNLSSLIITLILIYFIFILISYLRRYQFCNNFKNGIR